MVLAVLHHRFLLFRYLGLEWDCLVARRPHRRHHSFPICPSRHCDPIFHLNFTSRLWPIRLAFRPSSLVDPSCHRAHWLVLQPSHLLARAASFRPSHFKPWHPQQAELGVVTDLVVLGNFIRVDGTNIYQLGWMHRMIYFFIRLKLPSELDVQ